MRPLSAGEMIYAWETGQTRHLVDRALLLLALTTPQASIDELVALTVGQRNAHLLALRQHTLGTMADCFAVCPECDSWLEFKVDLTALSRPEPEQRDHRLTVDGFDLSFRLPNSRDLAAVVNGDDVPTGRRRLIERCVLKVERQDQAANAADLPERVIQTLAEAVLESDPLAEIELELNCSACGHTWTMLFDIVSFFWAEIDARAKRLLREVHALARAYGWREADILSLSTARRNFYLELVS